MDDVIASCREMGYTATKETVQRALGDNVRYLREKTGLSLRQLARNVGRDREYIRAIEAGHAWPDRNLREHIMGSMGGTTQNRDNFRAMDEILLALFNEEAAAATGDAAPSTPTPAAPKPAAPPAPPKEAPTMAKPAPPAAAPAPAQPAKIKHPFRIALYLERTAAGLKDDEAGQLVGVAGSTVSCWETGRWVPTVDNYKKLIDIFPGLLDHQKPASRDIQRQGPQPGPTPDPKEAMPEPTPAPVQQGMFALMRLLKKAQKSPDIDTFRNLLALADSSGASVQDILQLLDE
jgi:transcriptional regulator with XRE-family HTH domain